MKFFFFIMALSMLLGGNAYSITTSLICKLKKSNNTFSILLDHQNKNATWDDMVIGADFSATSVTFIVAEVGSINNVHLKMHYSLNRINLEVVKTVTLTRTINTDKIDEVISLERGVCEIGKKIERKF